MSIRTSISIYYRVALLDWVETHYDGKTFTNFTIIHQLAEQVFENTIKRMK